MGEAESELLRNSELGTGAPGLAVTFPRSHSSEQGGGRPGQELPAQGPLTANPLPPTPSRARCSAWRHHLQAHPLPAHRSAPNCYPFGSRGWWGRGGAVI